MARVVAVFHPFRWCPTGTVTVVLSTVRRAAALGAGLGLGVGAGAVGIGWFYSGVLLRPDQRPAWPERVLEVGRGELWLASTRLAGQPGVWGLRWPDGLTVVGAPVRAGRTAVRRPVLSGSVPPAGTAAVMDTGPWDPDPGARGLGFRDVAVETALGPAPAWEIPADGPVWVVAVHGRGSSRREVLRVLPALHRAGYPVLAISYRNDFEAPASPDGRYHLGDTEWQDLEAAVRHALDAGSRGVVVLGWSMGGALSAAFLDRSPLARHVRAVVWDAPLVDWRATLRLQAANRRLPAFLTPVATRVTSSRIGIDFDRFDLLACPPAVRPPTLLLHSSEDTVVPVEPSRALAAAAPALDWPMHYVEVPGVEHTGSWNADPQAYDDLVTGFLRRHVRTGA